MCRRSSLFVLASVMVAAACGDAGGPAAPATALPTAKFSDGRFAGGNDDFFFLPPIMPDPRGTANYDAAGFNGRLGPTVSVCQLAANPLTTPATDCALDASNKPILVASFSSSQISVATDQYHVNWHTDDSNLLADRFYRLQVFLGSVRLGFADIDPVTNGRDLKNANTGEVIPLVDGRTLPVKFRIENGALCTNKVDCGEFTVTNTGGTFTSNTRDAAIQFQPGFLPVGVNEITVKIERVRVGPNNNCHGEASSRLWKEYEGCYEMSSDPDLRQYGGIQRPAVAAQCVEITASNPLFEFLQPYKSHNGGELQRLTNVAQTFLDCEGFQGSTASIGSANPMVRFASAGLRLLGDGLGKAFGIRTLNAIDLGLGEELPIGSALSRFNWAIGLTAGASGGTEQAVGFGLPATQPLQVHVTSLHFHPSGVEGDHPEDVPGVPVRFSVTEGDGYFELGADQLPIRTKDVLTGTDGRASVILTAASNASGNKVTAVSPTLDPRSGLAEFLIAGLAPDLVVEKLTPSNAQPNTNSALGWTFDVRNAGPGRAIASTARLVVSLEEEGTETVASFDIPVPALAPGESITLRSPVLDGPRDAGDHSVMIMANATTGVVEASDANNAASQDFTIGSSVACSLESSTRSLNSNTPATVQFINRTTQAVSVYWLDFTGQRVLYTVLTPGGSYTQPTYITHPWIVIGADATCYGISLPTPGTSSVVVP